MAHEPKRAGRDRCVFGEVAQDDRPFWEPLERVVGMELADAFMWMYEIDVAGDGGQIQAYKHIDTRRYLHLDAEGRAYEYLAEQRYRPLPLWYALHLVLHPWERLGASPEELELVRAAIDRACEERGDEDDEEEDVV